MTVDISFHYPPALINLLIQAIPKLCRSKKDVLMFFLGAGVKPGLLQDLSDRIDQDSQNITKYDIARTILKRLNENGEATLRERRELLKRVVEFENFSTCWPGDQMAAKGYVAEIRELINIKDSFTRMQQKLDVERQQHQAKQQAKVEEIRQKQVELENIRKELTSLFAVQNSQKRGKALEGVLNRLFKFGGISVREAFTLVGSEGQGIVEQIDGAIELDGNVYLVEMKWWNQPIGVEVTAQHLVRIISRAQVRGIFISASGYTEPAISGCKDFLQNSIVVLCTLQELVRLLERESDLKDFLKKKIEAAIIDKNPFYDPFQ